MSRNKYISRKKYIPLLLEWAKEMGWDNAVHQKHKYKKSFIHWIEAGDWENVHLLIIFLPNIRASVHALPFTIWTGCHRLPPEILEKNHAETPSDTDFSFFHKENYMTEEARQKLKDSHPEFFGYRWAEKATKGGVEKISEHFEN